MEKYVKFYMRNKALNVTLPFEQAERVIDSPNQIVKLLDKQGNWTGDTINKAEIVGTTRDSDEERHANYNEKQLPEPKREPIDSSKFRASFMREEVEM